MLVQTRIASAPVQSYGFRKDHVLLARKLFFIADLTLHAQSYKLRDDPSRCLHR